MNESFNVGEIATFQNARFFPECNGDEVVVECGPGFLGFSDRITGEIRSEFGYYIRHSWGERVFALPHQLRKRRPPQDPTYVKWRDQLVKEFAMGESSHV